MAVTGDTTGLKQLLIDKLTSLTMRLEKDVRVTSGKREGDINASAHNSGIAADVAIPDLDSIAIADELVIEGFSGIGEYYEDDEQIPRSFAHGDIRGLPGSEESGKYAPGGEKSSKLCWYATGDPLTYTYGHRKSGKKCP